MNSESAAADYYIWSPPDKPVSVELSIEVVDRLLLEVMRGFGAVPRRGAEVGGLLLGRAEAGGKLTVRVESFEPVACEHASGPSYLLSLNDIRRLEAALDRCKPGGGQDLTVVGFYRSHTRSGLALAPEDISLLNAYLPEAAKVALLVKPFATRASVGGFFCRLNGSFTTDPSWQEFPFRRRELGGAALLEKKDPETAPESAPPEELETLEENPLPPFDMPPAEPEAEEERAPEAAHAPTARRNLWKPLSFVLMMLGALLGFITALAIQPRIQPTGGPDPYALALSVQESDGSLHVRWDRLSPAIVRASRGLLHIQDGSYRKTVQMDAGQLRNGSVIYRNNFSPLVSFRLEVYGSEKNTLSETIEYHHRGQ